MTQQKTVRRLQKCTLKRESTYGVTPGSMYAARFKDPGLALALKQTQVKDDGQSTRMFDRRAHRKGNKAWEASGAIDLRPENDQLDAAATAGDSWMTDLLRVCFGGQAAAAGSTVASATDGTGFVVAAGHGARFLPGCILGVSHGGVMAYAVITNVSTDTLSVYPTLPFTPTAADKVINGYNNWPTELISETFALTAAHVQTSSSQYTLNHGTVAELGITVGIDALVSASVKLQGLGWTGPSAQSLDTSAITDVLINPIHCANAFFILQAATTLTRVANPVISADFKMMFGVTYLKEFIGTNQQTTGIERVADKTFASVSMKCREDPTIETWYNEAGEPTELSMLLVIPYGSGDTTRAVVIHLATCFVADKPQVAEEGGVNVTSFTLESQLSQLNASTTAGTAAAPLVLARL